MRTFAVVLLMAVAAAAQTTTTPKKASTKKAAKAPKIKPLPKGKTRVFQAVVMKVVGVAQARADKKGKWKKLKVNDVLKPGVRVRTGRKSLVALRVGPNATVVVDRQTRVVIPQIVQNGETLRTRVGVEFGRVDVKASRIGLAIDFAVSTPSSTLAVRGTAFRISWDAVHGARARGIPSNAMRAIEMAYVSRAKASLSKADASSEEYPLPAFDGFWDTFIVPLEGAITPEVIEDPRIQPTDLTNPIEESGLRSSNQRRGSKLGELGPGSTGGNGGSTGDTGDSIPPPTREQ
ncbi:MAG: FecR domain-containing protein [Planctomycetota bacterium]